MKILLHVCCGPCASVCLERLLADGHETTLFFSNANIAPRAEYIKRLEGAQQLAKAVGVTLVEDESSVHQAWLEAVAKGYETSPEGGERCGRCFAFNLKRAARYAAANGFDGFTTSLTVSPHKNSDLVAQAGRAADATLFIERNFKKQEGFKRSLEITAKLGLYRQNYCGCEFSCERGISCAFMKAQKTL